MRYDLLHPKALRDALIKAGVKGVPSEHQVRNWTTGRSQVPRWVRPHIDRLVGQQETASPEGTLTRRLLTGSIALERKLGVTADELAVAEAEAMVLIAHLLGGNGTPPQQSGGGGVGGAAD